MDSEGRKLQATLNRPLRIQNGLPVLAEGCVEQILSRLVVHGLFLCSLTKRFTIPIPTRRGHARRSEPKLQTNSMKIISKLSLFFIALGFAMQLSGCGGAEVSSAKLYRQQRNYVKADQMLEQAIAKNRQDPEANALYIRNLYDLNRYEKIAQEIDTAWKYAAEFRQDVDAVRYNTWVALYNGGVGAYEQNPESPEQQKAAMDLLIAAQKLMPDRPETYGALGMIQEVSGDTVSAVATYNEALNQMRSSHEQGINMGLMLKMSPEAAERAIGGAPQTKQTVSVGNDSAMVYVYPGTQTYLYFEKAERAPRNWELTGWRFGANDQAGMTPMRISTDVYRTVSNYYYQRGLAQLSAKNVSGAEQEFDRALPLLITVQRLDPADEYAAGIIPDIYLRTNRTDKAKQQYEKMLAENPNKAMYSAYGNLLLKSNEYENAINAYTKAIALDPAYEPALFNTAATYKNWAAAEQKAGKKDYKTKLEKSSEYFERLMSVNPNDFNAIANLVENYEIQGRKDKTAAMLTRLEGMKTSEAAQSPEYWDHLGALYAKANRAAESAEAYKRGDQLRNK